MNEEKCCGTCSYHGFRYINGEDGWVCCNGESEYFTDWTEYEDGCGDWEEKE